MTANSKLVFLSVASTTVKKENVFSIHCYTRYSWVKGYIRIVEKYVTGRRKRFRTYKEYIFLIRINNRVDLAKSICPYELRDLRNY